MSDQLLYFDHAATTPMREEVREAMLPYLTGEFGNPSSPHAVGQQARRALLRARRAIASRFAADRDEVVFTGNGSEANVLALIGCARALPASRRHVLVSSIEHASVLDTARDLAASGEIELEELPVDPEGRVDPEQLAGRLRPHTGLVSVMTANNELGTLQPVREIGERLRDTSAVFHTDACQAIGKTAVNARSIHADLLTFSPHKFGGPRGVGVLIRRRHLQLRSPFSAGRQEQGLRGGTEDVASCVGVARALEVAEGARSAEEVHTRALAASLREFTAVAFPEMVVHSPQTGVLPGFFSFSLPDILGSWLVAALDQRRVAVSHGSACSSLAALPSHVLIAVGAKAFSRRSVRVSLGRTNTAEHVDEFVRRLRLAVDEIRKSEAFFSSQERRKR